MKVVDQVLPPSALRSNRESVPARTTDGLPGITASDVTPSALPAVPAPVDDIAEIAAVAHGGERVNGFDVPGIDLEIVDAGEIPAGDRAAQHLPPGLAAVAGPEQIAAEVDQERRGVEDGQALAWVVTIRFQVSPALELRQSAIPLRAYRVSGWPGAQAMSVRPFWPLKPRANGCQVCPPSVLRNERAPEPRARRTVSGRGNFSTWTQEAFRPVSRPVCQRSPALRLRATPHSGVPA